MSKAADIQGFLDHMVVAPTDHMDATMIPRLKALAENKERKASDLLHIIDDCVYASLCSDFSILAMDIAWKAMLEEEGKTVEQGFAEATWRGDRRGVTKATTYGV
jgi:hypothetical protein